MECFERSRTLADEHVDWLGHVNNVVWLELVIDLATSHSRAVGLATGDYQELGAAWAVRRHELDYHRPAFAGDEILEQTWIEEMRGARSIRRARFVRPADGALLVKAHSVRASPDVLARFPVMGEPPG